MTYVLMICGALFIAFLLSEGLGKPTAAHWITGVLALSAWFALCLVVMR
jgi:hypothetical protein